MPLNGRRTHTIMHTNILNKNIHQFMQFKIQKQISTEKKQAKNNKNILKKHENLDIKN
jgi:hypothetical protein